MKEVSAAIPSHLMKDARDEAGKAKNVMGKDDFMKLLMTQLRHQDPMKPMDHHEMGTQLAQFSQLEQLSNIGAGIQGLRSDRGDDAKLQAIGMIGKRVQAAGNDVNLVEGESVTLRPNIKGDVQPSKAQVYAPDGKLVRELDLAGKPSSDSISWDGKDTEGKALPSGRYTFRVHGVGRNGQAQEIGTELSGRVTGMELQGKTPLLLVQTASGQSKLELTKVTSVLLDDKEAVAEKKPDTPPVVAVADEEGAELPPELGEMRMEFLR